MLTRILFSCALLFAITAGVEAQYPEDIRYQNDQQATSPPNAAPQDSLNVDAMLPVAWRGNFVRNYKVILPVYETPHTTGTHSYHDGTGQFTQINSPITVKKAGNTLAIHYRYEMIIGAANNEVLSRTNGHTVVTTSGETVLKDKTGEIYMLTVNEVKERVRYTVKPNTFVTEQLRKMYAQVETLADQVAATAPSPVPTQFILHPDGKLELVAGEEYRRVLAPE